MSFSYTQVYLIKKVVLLKINDEDIDRCKLYRQAGKNFQDNLEKSIIINHDHVYFYFIKKKKFIDLYYCIL